jgi:hypothetical protein
MNLTPQQSHYVLKVLMADGRIRASQVERALKSRQDEIRSLKERLASLEAMGGPGSAGSARSGRGARARRGGRSAPVRRRRMSPRVRALRRLQGKYMGYVRRLKPAEKARVRAVREKQGMAAAIRLASSIASRS